MILIINKMITEHNGNDNNNDNNKITNKTEMIDN